MNTRALVLSALLALSPAVATAAVLPAQAAGMTVPVQCEVGSETLLPWDGVSYDLRGTCGVVRVTADGATVTMPSATRLVVEGTDNTVVAKPILDAEVTGARTTLTTPSLQSLVMSGGASTITVTGLLEHAELTSTSSSLTADTIHVLKARGTDAVTARLAYRTRITGSDNVVRFRRSDRLVLTGDRNGVTVERGRTTVRDRGDDNVLDLRPRRR